MSCMPFMISLYIGSSRGSRLTLPEELFDLEKSVTVHVRYVLYTVFLCTTGA